jgi:hypothetical protein
MYLFIVIREAAKESSRGGHSIAARSLSDCSGVLINCKIMDGLIVV